MLKPLRYVLLTHIHACQLCNLFQFFMPVWRSVCVYLDKNLIHKKCIFLLHCSTCIDLCQWFVFFFEFIVIWIAAVWKESILGSIFYYKCIFIISDLHTYVLLQLFFINLMLSLILKFTFALHVSLGHFMYICWPIQRSHLDNSIGNLEQSTNHQSPSPTQAFILTCTFWNVRLYKYFE